jgi:ABC-type glutathione transport system ATPase component
MSKFLSAEELEAPYIVDPDAEHAVAMDADFTWETVKKSIEKDKKKEEDKAKEDGGKAKKETGKKEKTEKGADKKKGQDAGLSAPPDDKKEDAEATPDPEDPPFEVKDIKVNISKGSLVGIVGKIGSGKVSEGSVF